LDQNQPQPVVKNDSFGSVGEILRNLSENICGKNGGGKEDQRKDKPSKGKKDQFHNSILGNLPDLSFLYLESVNLLANPTAPKTITE
jgi:hypothetical protein